MRRGREGKETPAADCRHFYRTPPNGFAPWGRQLSHENQSLLLRVNVFDSFDSKESAKSRFAFRFVRFAKDNQKFAPKFKPNRGLKIDQFIRPG